ncbi:MAG: hypothetical protein V9H25_06555 [Candidatus Competibacter sp.]
MKPQLNYYSDTSEGPIPHKQYKGFRLCVKLDTDNKVLTNIGYKHPPLKRDGRLVWALPGNQEIIFDD